MTISDLITIISLIIAILAIISEKNRKHLLLKFSKFDFILYGFAFILINYFVFYNQFYENGYYFSFLFFSNFGFENPSIYSYLISLLVLISILFKTWYSFYPNRKREQVLKYYRNLIENNEIPTLLDIIEKYHLKDICSHIESTEANNTDSNKYIYDEFREITKKEKIINVLNDIWRNINPYSKVNRHSYASFILFDIVNDPAFIELSSNYRPYFFANIIKTFSKEKRNSFPDDLTNRFLIELIKSKNFWLIKELKQSERFDYGQPVEFFDENKIIASLIKDLSVADTNEIWTSLGEQAINEIEDEKHKGFESKLCQEYRNDEILWNHKVYISIKFFHILIVESIAKKYSGTNFTLQYYWHITDKILINITSRPPKDFEEIDSIYHHLITEMTDNLFHWLSLSNKYETDLFYDIVRCIGNIINCTTKNPYYGQKRNLDLVERVIKRYCNLEQNSKTELIREQLEKILNKPSMLSKPSDPYYIFMSQAWNTFDKIPHKVHATNRDCTYFSKLKQNVIIPLGLNPDEL
ncbi:MAG: hypothetical protein WCK02_01595 [Bacteroidota bacterium]